MKVAYVKLLLRKESEKSRKAAPDKARFIGPAYAAVIKKIRDNFSDREHLTDAKIDKMDITAYMNAKLKQIIQQKITPQLEKENELNKLKEALENTYGLGAQKIKELLGAGLKNVRQLHAKKWREMLNTDTIMMLDHSPMRPIPHKNIDQIAPKITGYGRRSKLPHPKIVISGSYRRQKPYSNDIDILFTSEYEQDPSDYLGYLRKTFDGVWIYAHGDQKISFILQHGRNKYKADIFLCTPETFYTSLLYTTGSKNNNITMRSRAKRLGYLLNHEGIFDKRTGKKVNKPNDDERKLFAILKMPYLEPHQRH